MARFNKIIEREFFFKLLLQIGVGHNFYRPHSIDFFDFRYSNTSINREINEIFSSSDWNVANYSKQHLPEVSQ
jgi:hypothetical protein